MGHIGGRAQTGKAILGRRYPPAQAPNKKKQLSNEKLLFSFLDLLSLLNVCESSACMNVMCVRQASLWWFPRS